METKGTRLKKFLFALILVVLLIPFMEQHVKFYDSEKLHGAITPAPESWFSLSSWFSGHYQEDYEKWYNENFGFRPELVRLHNQIAFSCYGAAKANGVIIGKNGY